MAPRNNFFSSSSSELLWHFYYNFSEFYHGAAFRNRFLQHLGVFLVVSDLAIELGLIQRQIEGGVERAGVCTPRRTAGPGPG